MKRFKIVDYKLPGLAQFARLVKEADMRSFQKQLASLLIGLTLSACAAVKAAPTATMVPTPIVAQKPTYKVQRGTVTRLLELSGRVVPVRQQELFFRSDGYVKAVYFRRGESVKAGDLLAELETGSLAVDLAEAELALKEAEAKLIQTLEDNAEDLIEAQLALDQANLDAIKSGALGVSSSSEEAKANLKTLAERMKTNDQLYQDALKNKNLSEFDLGEFRKAYEEARRRYENAQALLEAEQALDAAQQAMSAAREAYAAAQADPDLSDEQKSAAFQAFEQATGAYVSAWVTYARTLGGKFPLGYEARKAGMEAALARMKVEKLLRGADPMLTLDVEKARLSLQTTQEKVENARLVAPFDGEILSLGLAAGSQATAFEAVMVLADPSVLEITAIPTGEEVSSLGVGQEAVVRLSAQPGKEFAARVLQLPVISSTSSTEDTIDQAVHIALEDTSQALTLGEAATIIIQIETRQDVLWLPPAAIRTFQGQDFVFVESSGVQRRVNVRLGLRSEDRVEIRDGLEEGSIVIGQ